MSDSDDGAQGSWGSRSPSVVVQILIKISRITFLGRGGARKQLYRLVSWLHPGPIDVRVWDRARVRLHHQHNLTERKALMRPSRLDPIELAWIRTRMSDSTRVYVDIGANAGFYVLHTALVCGAKAKLVAIEPNRSLLQRMQFNIGNARADGLIHDDVTVVEANIAISDTEDRAMLSDTGDEGSRALLDAGVGTEVRTNRLSKVVQDFKIQKIDVLKIDIEGHEDRALLPFLEDAPKSMWPMLIVIEHVSRSNWQTDCIKDCVMKGYKIVAETNNNTILDFEAELDA